METRPDAERDLVAAGYDRDFVWYELVIRPFDSRMLKVGDKSLQWADDDEECIVIPWSVYWLLGLAWPILFRLYSRNLLGQRT